MATLVHSPPWRFVVTDRSSVVLTFLDHLASKRQLVYELDKPATARGVVPSDSPEVNIVHDDGDPFLEEGNRLLFGFRRETGTPPWKCRFAGPILIVNDVLSGDQPVTSFTAFDPWQYLFKRPIRLASGALPGRTGLTYVDTRGSTIALELLRNTIATDGPCYLDAGLSWGGTAFYGGTLEDTSRLDFNLQQVSTVGEAWVKLAETGSLDIVLTPVWDPIARPGICCEVNIYPIAGTRRNGAVFAWDKPSRSLSGIDRLDDGQQRENVVQYYLQEGHPVEPLTDVASVAKYGTWWGGQTFPGDTTYAEVEAYAAEQLLFKRDGSETIQINPAADRSPVPFVEYFLGDAVPVYASKRLRRAIDAGTVVDGAWSSLQRVYKIPITVGDDNIETVDQLEFSADGDLLP